MTALHRSLIKQALLDVDSMERAFADSRPNPNPILENESRLETQRIVRDYKGRHQVRKISIKRKIAIGLVTALLLISTMLSVGAIRKPIVEFFVEVFDGFIGISSDENIGENPNSSYIPLWLPPTYTEQSKDIYEYCAYYTWSNGRDNITMSQRLGTLTDTYLDNEGSNYTTQSVSDYTVHYTLKNGVYLCLWANESYTFILKCPESVGWENVTKIISSVQRA